MASQGASPFDGPWNFDHARSIARFLHVGKEYCSFLRDLPKESPTEHNREIEIANSFIRLATQEHVWPLMQTVVPEFRQPIDSKATSLSWLFRYILERLQQLHPVEDEVPGSAADTWEEDLMLQRIEADIEYSTWNFAYFCENQYKDQARARIERALKMKEKYRKSYKECIALTLEALRKIIDKPKEGDGGDVDEGEDRRIEQDDLL